MLAKPTTNMKPEMSKTLVLCLIYFISVLTPLLQDGVVKELDEFNVITHHKPIHNSMDILHQSSLLLLTLVTVEDLRWYSMRVRLYFNEGGIH